MRRLRDESGFTLIEILTVVVILTVLVSLAVPAYQVFTGTAQTAGSKANVRSAITAAEEINNENGSYAGMTGAALRSMAPGIGPAVKAVAVNANRGYCIEDSESSGATFSDYVGGTPGSALQPGFSATAIQSGTCLQAVGVAAS